MFTTLDQALETLYQRTSKATFGLKQFHQCMQDMNHPQHNINCIHVAGTNGKGSVSHFVASILSQGYAKVGLYTSPFLIKHNDRFRINDQMISDERLLAFINQSIPYWQPYSLTMFEIDTLIAFWYFLDEKVDWAVFEVGLGGRLDATNIIKPKLSIITEIGMDHMDYLGDTIEKITFEKAGIIKPYTPIVTSNQKENVVAVLKEVAQMNHAPFYQASKPQSISEDLFSQQFMVDGLVVTLQTGASYQQINASLAITAIRILNLNQQTHLSDQQILNGCAQSIWLGRFEPISKKPLIILDGAHNEHGINALVNNFHRLPKPISVVFAALRDKETHKMVRKLIAYSNHCFITEFDFYRVEKATEIAKPFGLNAYSDYKQAINDAIALSHQGTTIICGSLYFISEVRSYFKNQESI